MPPHCDTMNGPVVKAAKRALQANDVSGILAYVPKQSEKEVIGTFERAAQVMKEGGAEAREVADLYFFETVVRVHRAGEGAAYTGLKPTGLDEGPVIPVAEKAIETDSPDALIDLLCGYVREEVTQRFHHMQHLKEHAGEGVDADRAYVSAMLGLQVWSHGLYQYAKADPYVGHHEH